MRIADAARHVGTSGRMLRYYEGQGVLAPRRDANGYRDYSDADVRAARRIVALSAAGLPLASIRVILPCVVGEGRQMHIVDPRGCPWIEPELRRRLAAVREQIDILRDSAAAMERYLGTLEPMAASSAGGDD